MSTTWNEVVEELSAKAPLMLSVLSAMTKHDLEKEPTDEDIITIAVTASMLLYNRNHKCSRVQYAVGLAVDQCGITKEVHVVNVF